MQRNRKHWVHPILKNRFSTSLYLTLYPSLRNYKPNFFNYFRESNQSVNNLLEQNKEGIMADQNAFRYCISPKEKLSWSCWSNRELSCMSQIASLFSILSIKRSVLNLSNVVDEQSIEKQVLKIATQTFRL